MVVVMAILNVIAVVLITVIAIAIAIVIVTAIESNGHSNNTVNI